MNYWNEVTFWQWSDLLGYVWKIKMFLEKKVLLSKAVRFRSTMENYRLCLFFCCHMMTLIKQVGDCDVDLFWSYRTSKPGEPCWFKFPFHLLNLSADLSLNSFGVYSNRGFCFSYSCCRIKVNFVGIIQQISSSYVRIYCWNERYADIDWNTDDFTSINKIKTKK